MLGNVENILEEFKRSFAMIKKLVIKMHKGGGDNHVVIE